MKILTKKKYKELFLMTQKVVATKEDVNVDILRKAKFLEEILIEENDTLDYHHNIEIDEVSINKLNNFLHSSKDDKEAAIIIHKMLNPINNSEANDKRLWGYLTCVKFKKYVIERWDFNSSSSKEKFKNRFFYEGTGTTIRAYNAIARLYWAAERTYNSSNTSDPYHLTKMFYINQDVTTLFERNLGAYNKLLIEYLLFIERNQDKITSKFAQDLNAGINARGGVQDLSLLSKEDIREVIRSVCDFYGYDNLSF